jgi:hypothetical protein
MKKWWIISLLIFSESTFANLSDHFQSTRRNLANLIGVLEDQKITSGLIELKKMESSVSLQMSGDDDEDWKRLKQLDREVQQILIAHGIGQALTDRSLLTAKILRAIVDLPPTGEPAEDYTSLVFTGHSIKEWSTHFENLAKEIALDHSKRPSSRGKFLFQKFASLQNSYRAWADPISCSVFANWRVDLLYAGGAAVIVGGLAAPFEAIGIFGGLYCAGIAGSVTMIARICQGFDSENSIIEKPPKKFWKTLETAGISPSQKLDGRTRVDWLKVFLTDQGAIDHTYYFARAKAAVLKDIDTVLAEMRASFGIDPAKVREILDSRDEVLSAEAHLLEVRVDILKRKFTQFDLGKRLAPFDPDRTVTLTAQKVLGAEYDCKVNLAAIGAGP